MKQQNLRLTVFMSTVETFHSLAATTVHRPIASFSEVEQLAETLEVKNTISTNTDATKKRRFILN